jgi:membrane protease YdiL (CAAX protease family)
MTLALGAGIYEELVFRLFLTGSLVSLFLHVMPNRKFVSKLFAVAISATLFAAFHYIGREQITLDSFAFRFCAGIVLGTLFIWRGIGIAAYTHAFYDLTLLFHK